MWDFAAYVWCFVFAFGVFFVGRFKGFLVACGVFAFGTYCLFAFVWGLVAGWCFFFAFGFSPVGRF